MTEWLSQLVDTLSEYFSTRKGLLPLVGMALILLNLLLQFLIPGHWLATSNLSLHVGLLVAIFGLMLAWAL